MIVFLEKGGSILGFYVHALKYFNKPKFDISLISWIKWLRLDKGLSLAGKYQSWDMTPFDPDAKM